MKKKWVIETKIEEQSAKRLADSVRKYGGEVREIDFLPFNAFEIDEIQEGERFYFHGSIQASKWLEVVGGGCHLFWDTWQYNCSNYYSKVYGHLWNSEHVFMPFNLLEKKKEDLAKYVGVNNCIFIRPDSPNKQFTGTVVDIDTWEKDFKLISFYKEDIDDDMMCVVAAPMTCYIEMRFIVGGGKIITGSYYIEDKKKKVEEITSGELEWRNAQTILNHINFNPDIIWVMDICAGSTGYPYILECGPFSASGLYACNTDKIVEYIHSNT